MLTIIGCGCANKSDDGVGPYVARQLQRYLDTHPKTDVQVFDAGITGMQVMFLARGADAVHIIDASTSGSEPGSVFEVPDSNLLQQPAPAMGLHDFRWEHAVHAGRQMFQDAFPKIVKVWLIEAENLNFGIELSDSARAGADTVVERLIRLIDGTYEEQSELSAR